MSKIGLIVKPPLANAGVLCDDAIHLFVCRVKRVHKRVLLKPKQFRAVVSTGDKWELQGLFKESILGPLGCPTCLIIIIVIIIITSDSKLRPMSHRKPRTVPHSKPR